MITKRRTNPGKGITMGRRTIRRRRMATTSIGRKMMMMGGMTMTTAYMRGRGCET